MRRVRQFGAPIRGGGRHPATRVRRSVEFAIVLKKAMGVAEANPEFRGHRAIAEE